MRGEVIVVVVLALAPLAEAQTRVRPQWDQEPMSYRGVPWGATPAYADDHLDEDFNVVTKCHCDDGRECPPSRVLDAPPPQRICLAETVVGGVPLKEIWTFMVDHLAGVYLTFDSDNYGQMRSMFIQRYGPPTRTERPPFKTRGGLEATNEVLSWDRGSITAVRLEQYGGTITDGNASVMTKTLLNEILQAGRKREAEGAKVF